MALLRMHCSYQLAISKIFLLGGYVVFRCQSIIRCRSSHNKAWWLTNSSGSARGEFLGWPVESPWAMYENSRRNLGQMMTQSLLRLIENAFKNWRPSLRISEFRIDQMVFCFSLVFNPCVRRLVLYRISTSLTRISYTINAHHLWLGFVILGRDCKTVRFRLQMTDKRISDYTPIFSIDLEKEEIRFIKRVHNTLAISIQPPR